MKSKIFTELTLSEQANLSGGNTYEASYNYQENDNYTTQYATAVGGDGGSNGSRGGDAYAYNFNYTDQRNIIRNRSYNG